MIPDDQVDLTEFDRLADEAWRSMMLRFDTPIPAPSWSAWMHRTRARLWEVVALSLKFDPVAVRQINRQVAGIDSPAAQLAREFPMHRQSHEATVQRRELELLPRLMMDDGFVRRLQVACDHVSVGGPLRPVHPIPLAGVDHAVVQIAEFAAWATLPPIGWTLPKSFPAVSMSKDDERSNALTTLIERHCREVGAPWPAADVWARLKASAESDDPPLPLVDSKDGVIIYMNHESNEELTYAQFEDRMYRWRKKQGSGRAKSR